MEVDAATYHVFLSISSSISIFLRCVKYDSKKVGKATLVYFEVYKVRKNTLKSQLLLIIIKLYILLLKI